MPDFDLQTIETGDSVKVKQVFDESILEAITEAGYKQNFFWENTKLFLMFSSCVFAMVAQFFPIPFPASRPLLGLCCASYFILSVILQYIVTYVDKDTIMITNPIPVRIFLILKLFN
jgi:signal peptidase complex subunit 2